MNSGEKLDDAWGVDRALQQAIRSLPFGGRYPPQSGQLYWKTAWVTTLFTTIPEIRTKRRRHP